MYLICCLAAPRCLEDTRSSVAAIAVSSCPCTSDPNPVLHLLYCTVFASYCRPMRTTRGAHRSGLQAALVFPTHSRNKRHGVNPKTDGSAICTVFLHPRVHMEYSALFRTSRNLCTYTTPPLSRMHLATYQLSTQCVFIRLGSTFYVFVLQTFLDSVAKAATTLLFTALLPKTF